MRFSYVKRDGKSGPENCVLPPIYMHMHIYIYCQKRRGVLKAILVIIIIVMVINNQARVIKLENYFWRFYRVRYFVFAMHGN